MLLKIYPKPPFDFEKTLIRIRDHHELVFIENGKIVRTMRPGAESSPVLIRIESVGSVDNPILEVEVVGEIDVAGVESLRVQLEHMLTVNVDLSSFYAKMAEDPVMKGVVDRHYGLRLLTDADLFESMVRTIIGQQLNLSFAATLTKRLVAVAAEPFSVDGFDYPVFPTPEQVSRLEVQQLRELQFSQRKAEYVIDFAKAILEGTVDLDSFWGMEDEQITEQLVRLRGIGRWTAECLLLFGLARSDLLPAADIGLRNAVRRQYGLNHQPSETEVRELGANWAPFRSYATFYLWETLDE